MVNIKLIDRIMSIVEPEGFVWNSEYRWLISRVINFVGFEPEEALAVPKLGFTVIWNLIKPLFLTRAIEAINVKKHSLYITFYYMARNEFYDYNGYHYLIDFSNGIPSEIRFKTIDDCKEAAIIAALDKMEVDK